MTCEEIKAQAERHPGLNFSMKAFRKVFGLPLTGSTKLLNQLIADNIVERVSAGQYRVVKNEESNDNI